MRWARRNSRRVLDVGGETRQCADLPEPKPAIRSLVDGTWEQPPPPLMWDLSPPPDPSTVRDRQSGPSSELSQARILNLRKDLTSKHGRVRMLRVPGLLFTLPLPLPARHPFAGERTNRLDASRPEGAEPNNSAAVEGRLVLGSSCSLGAPLATSAAIASYRPTAPRAPTPDTSLSRRP